MKTTIGAIGAACALFCGIASGVRAEPNSPDVGQVLLLDNERLVEGDIHREGNRYRIRRELGESWIPADKVVRLCASREEAFQTLRARANLRDVDERLRLARWCQLHGLMEQGLTEVQGALEIRPNSSEAKRLLRCFQRDAEPSAPPEMPPPIPAPPAPVKESAAPPAPNAGLTMEAATLFSTRVQPILMNACANCHASERGGSFRLIQTHGDNGLNLRATQVNLAAAVAQVNHANGGASPLLTKAISIHGDLSQPPLKGRQLPAFNTLEEWVQKVVACSPETPVASAAPTKSEGIGAAHSTHEDASEPKPSLWASDTHSKAAPPATAPKPECPADAAPKPGEAVVRDVPRSVSTTPPPKPVQEPVDEFDPLHFNREAHPERVEQGKP
jgi:hypothetical protein